MNRLAAVIAAAAVASSACKTLDAPDQNAATLQDLSGTPTRATLQGAAQGLLAGVRASGPCTGTCAYIAREGENLDPSNPQGVPNTYLIGSDFAAWANPYANDLLANLVLKGVGNVTPSMRADTAAAVTGFVRTIKAIDLMFVIQTTDQTGAVLDVPAHVTDPIGTVANKAAVYTHILNLLDSGYADLTTAGSAGFPFTLSAGFNGFNTPGTFKYFNRAIKAREDAYIGNYAAALTDLGQAFGGPFLANPATLANLQVGPANTFSLTAGDLTNGVYDATDRQRFAHNILALEAQTQPGYAVLADTATKRDDRFLRKVRLSKTITNRYAFDVYWAYQVYNSLSDPIPLIRDEELILLRAEANLACTGVAPTPNCNGNRAAALADINTIRTISGKLAPLAADPGLDPATPPVKTGDLLLDELLYNKRYSLLWEGGYSWFDARKYGVLDKLNHGPFTGLTGTAVQNGPAGQIVFQYARLPDNECNARGITINQTPAGTGGPCQLAAGK
jgi:hypothetical protein